MMDLIAQAAAPEGHVPLSALKMFFAWITPFVVAIIGALGMRKARLKGREEGKASMSMTVDGQPIETKHSPIFVEAKILDDHLDRIDQQIRDLWEGISEDRKTARDSLGKVHKRIDDAVGQLNQLDGRAEGIEGITGRLLDIQLGLPQGTTVREQRKKRTSSK
jgi:hypothetical protein